MVLVVGFLERILGENFPLSHEPLQSGIEADHAISSAPLDQAWDHGGLGLSDRGGDGRGAHEDLMGRNSP